MILSAQTIAQMRPVKPFFDQKLIEHGLSYGLGPAGYDVRVREELDLAPGAFSLASTLELFEMPDSVLGIVHDKSTWARLGLAAQNTVIEPGWCGFLTLELSNHGPERIRVKAGSPIVQIIFHWLDRPTDRTYRGKYQHQKAGPQPAIF